MCLHIGPHARLPGCLLSRVRSCMHAQLVAWCLAAFAAFATFAAVLAFAAFATFNAFAAVAA